MSDTLINLGSGVMPGAERLAELDHTITEAVRDADGQVSMYRFMDFVTAYRRGSFIPDCDAAVALAATEVARQTAEMMGSIFTWGDYVTTLSQVITREAERI